MQIYQLRVEIRDAETPVWRRLLAPPSITLCDLHRVLQDAMDWDATHLYGFRVRGDSYGPKDMSWNPWWAGVFEPSGQEFDDRRSPPC